MDKTVQFLKDQLHGLRCTVSQGLFESMKIQCYGQQVLLKTVSVVRENQSVIQIEAFDQNTVSEILNAVKKAGFNPYLSSKKSVAITKSKETAEDREKVKKLILKHKEDARIAIRNIRREAKKDIDKISNDDIMRKEAKRLDDVTHNHICEIDSL